MFDENMKRLPPQNIEAEQMALGAMLIDARGVLPGARIRQEDFYKTVHGKIYAAVRMVYERNDEVDVLTVSDALKRDGALDEVGGASYLSQLIGMTPTAANYQSHERLVINAAMARRVVNVCAEQMQKAYDGPDPEEIISECITLLNDARRHEAGQIVPYSELITHGYELIEQNSEDPGKLKGITTGFPGIDRLTNGLQRKWFYIFAGRTGKGKTALAMQMGRNAAKAGHKVGVISVEMDPEQLALREISAESGVGLSRLLSGALGHDDWDRLPTAAGALHPLPIWCAFSAFTAQDVERTMNRFAQIHGCDMIIVDYLQLLSIEGHDGTREQEVSKISRMHKRKAKELGVAMIALAQLNRGVEARQDKRPGLHDLRESGSLEQDADVVAFVHQDECKCPREAPCLCGARYRAWYLQRKGRMNGTGDVELRWDGRTTSFRDVEG